MATTRHTETEDITMTQDEISKMIDDTIAEQDEAQREEELEDLLDLLGFDD